MKVLNDFKTFLFRGNVVDLAVAVVIGTAFTAVVKALVSDILTPVIAAIFGSPNFGNLKFTIHGSHFAYGDFLNNLFTFLTVAAAMFFLVVTPINWLMSRRAQEDPTPSSARSATRRSRSRRAVARSARHGYPAGRTRRPVAAASRRPRRLRSPRRAGPRSRGHDGRG